MSVSGQKFDAALSQLQELGEKNWVAEVLEAQASGHILPGTAHPELEENYCCNLGFIDTVVQEPAEPIYFRDSKGNYIVETRDKKGHEVRNMLVYNEHMEIPDPSDFITKEANIFKKTFDITAGQIKNNQKTSDHLIFIIGLNSEPSHYHIIASDLDGGSQRIEDLREVNNYIRWDISEDNYSFDEPEEVYYGDARGDLGLKPFYENCVEKKVEGLKR